MINPPLCTCSGGRSYLLFHTRYTLADTLRLSSYKIFILLYGRYFRISCNYVRALSIFPICAFPCYVLLEKISKICNRKRDPCFRTSLFFRRVIYKKVFLTPLLLADFFLITYNFVYYFRNLSKVFFQFLFSFL